MSKGTPRDPFAPLGYAGNRGIQNGKDGAIPGRYRGAVERAIPSAYQLAFNPSFEQAFNETLSKLTSRPARKNAYLEARDKITINYAETSKNPKAVQELNDDAISRARDKLYQSPPAFSIIGGNDVWLREFLLKKGEPKEIAGALMHEAAPLAGVPGDFLAEVALEKLGELSGYHRK